ncbi:hypothetical protein [Flavobacterium sp.]|uniref:hypothetical protein n=1 Tax=Flavobacterium sp. TaxID=239 RepID=UPI002B4AB894|nr:hypothetical protein [Flavobacterium sp.]HLP65106.1 hypothetical protein [Flavobacterium sp.]
MKKDKLVLLIALVVGILSTLANTFHYVEFVKISRLVFIPLIYIYYCLKAQKINWAPTLVMFLFLLTDIYNFIIKDALFELLVLGIVNYILFLSFGLKDIVKFRLTFTNVISFVIIVGFVVFLYFSVLDLALIELNTYKVSISIYGIVLGLNAIVAAYNLSYRNRLHDLLFFFCVATFVFTDVSYLISEYYYKFPVMIVINYILQLLSYFFIARYFIINERYDLRKKQLNHN